MKSVVQLRPFVLAIAILILAVAGDGRAATQTTDEIPPEALIPNQEAIELFAELETLSRSGETLPGLPDEMLTGMDPVIDQVLARGEQVPEWSRSGVDLFAAVAAREGGVAENVLQADGQFGPEIVYLVDRSFDDLIPSEWALLWARGHVEPGLAAITTVTYASPKVIYVERSTIRRQQLARCRNVAETRIYADPAVSASEIDTIAFFMGIRTIERLEQRPALCSLTEEVEPGIYRDRMFDAEGFHLPGIEAGLRPMRIVPRQPLSARRN